MRGDPSGQADRARSGARALAWRRPSTISPSERCNAEAARLEELRLAAFEELMQARLAAGQHADVIVELERLTRDHPYREEFRALHMIALYRSGRPGGRAARLSDHTRRARRRAGYRAFATTAPARGADPAAGPRPRPARGSVGSIGDDRRVENPYLGLRAFREADQARFFGQDQLIERLVDRVVGASRSLRSSVRAAPASRASCRQASCRVCAVTIPNWWSP